MLFQATNIIPDLRNGIGLGVVDAAAGMTVSWQVNGDFPAMTGMKIAIYLNDEASTQKYTTGKVSFGTPFYGVDALGNLQYYSYTISAATLSGAGITNGNEYKMLITQYYSDNGTEASVTQTSASVFITRSTPSFSLSSVPATVTSSSYTFTVNYSQTEGDTLDWIRYQIAQGSDTGSPIYDSGAIYGAAVYTSTYTSFRTGFSYSFRAFGQTSSGVAVDTGWEDFDVSYSVETASGSVKADVVKNVNGVRVDWTNMSTVTGQSRWIIFREQSGSGVLVKIAELALTVRKIFDCGAASGQGPYDYLVAAANSSGVIIGSMVRSAAIRPIFYRWTLMAAAENADGSFTVKKQYHFKYNLDSGSSHNNNTPGILQNFTAFPTVQPAPQNYLSGTVRALIGSVSSGKYTDTLTDRKELMALSVTDSPLFLKSSKGDVMRIRISGPVTATTEEKTESLAQTISVPWVATGDAAQESIRADA